MRNVQRIVLVGLATAIVATLAVGIRAGEDRDRDRDAPGADRQLPGAASDPAPSGERQRDAAPWSPPQGRLRPPVDENAEGTEEGMPEARVAPQLQPGGPGQPPRIVPQRWRLGVYALNTESGVLVTRVLPNSPAWREGLERRDRIVTVAGYQIGFVNGRLYPLGDELQRRADRGGRVALLVQDHRTGDLVPMPVQLEQYGRPPWPLLP